MPEYRFECAVCKALSYIGPQYIQHEPKCPREPLLQAYADPHAGALPPMGRPYVPQVYEPRSREETH